MDVIAEWTALPRLLAGVATEGDLDAKLGPDDFTRRELLHHLAEANLVAASIVVAALGSPGCTYDWSWMLPFGPWIERMQYGTKPVEPALALLAALADYVAAQVRPLADGLARTVHLRDAPDAELRRVTVADVLRTEVEHAHQHLGK